MSAKSNLLWVADQLATVREATRISNAQGGLFLLAATAPGREWTITGASSPGYNTKQWKLKVQTPRMLYVGVRFRAEPAGAGAFRYYFYENGATNGPNPITTANDYCHVHLVQFPMAQDPNVVPLDFQISIEAQTSNLVLRDLQIFGMDSATLPARVMQLGINKEVLTTS